MSSLELDRRLAELAAPKTRRGVLLGAGSLALAASLSRLPLDLAYGSTHPHRSNPFTLGVASGDPRHDSIVLWTRLAPEPLRADGGMEQRPVEVRWEVAKDPSMRRLVRRGRATALAVLRALASTSRSTGSTTAASTSTASPPARPPALSAAPGRRRAAG